MYAWARVHVDARGQSETHTVGSTGQPVTCRDLCLSPPLTKGIISAGYHTRPVLKQEF